ncbi:MAG: hypothetical protein HUU38_18915 [Anaerolineales bacterium]|nr:hypothetical protein [Anaerolineales bacterium]
MFRWIIISLFFVPFLAAFAVMYIQTANNKGHNAAVKTLFRSLLFFGVVIGIAFLMEYLIPDEKEDTVQIALSVLLSLLLLYFAIKLLYRRMQIKKNKILLHLGRSDESFFGIVLGILYVLKAFDDLREARFMLTESTKAIFHLLNGGFLALSGFFADRIVTAEGIFTPLRTIKWSKIRSYLWEEGKKPTLKLKMGGRFSWLNEIPLEIDPSQRDLLEELLKKNVSTVVWEE